MGPDRQLVRLRAGSDIAGHRLLFKGADRWRIAARSDAVPSRDIPGPLRSGSPTHILPLQLFHCESDRLCRRACQPESLGTRAGTRPDRSADTIAVAAPTALPW